MRGQVVLTDLERLATLGSSVTQGHLELLNKRAGLGELGPTDGGNRERVGVWEDRGVRSPPSGWTGPTSNWSALVSFGSSGHGPEVVELMSSRSVPDAGWVVREPSDPAGTVAPATPLTNSAEPAVTAATTAPDTSRVDSLFLRTM
jgi:hypothetical protein